MVNGWPVVTATEMSRLEKLAYAQGSSDAAFMEKAGESIANAADHFVQSNQLEKKITLLVGKGNNGGDALVAGRYLLNKGYHVVAHLLNTLTECSPLSQKAAEAFLKAGGKIFHDPPFEGVILDGLVGTGFKGKAEGDLAHIISQANLAGLPILSIDIPSGLNGDTGEVGSIAIKATQTLFLGLPKLGFFINKGWDHVGMLIPCDFGLPDKIIDMAKGEALLPTPDVFPAFLPTIKRTRHKYEAGYVLAFGSSSNMAGAGILASFAALKSGAGIVRLFHPEGDQGELSHCPLEIIKEPIGEDLSRLFEEAKRAQVLLVGPGLGRSDSVKKQLKELFAHISIPCVIDADALYFFNQCVASSLPANTVLTPHRGEMKHLIQREPTFSLCQEFVEKREMTLVLKGAPTVIFSPNTLPVILTYGDPGMATAGSGDVLGGIIAALIAQKLPGLQAAILGVYLHGCAGETAAKKKSSYSLIASDIIEELPAAFLTLTGS